MMPKFATRGARAPEPRPAVRADALASPQTPGRVLVSIGIALGSIATSQSLLAEGFRNPPAGAANLGRAGGRVAFVDDSSAIAHNPANLVDLPSAEFQFAPSFVYIRTDYQSPTGVTASTDNPWKFLPNFFISTPLKRDKFSVGLGVTTPYGLSNQWNASGSFADPTGLRYQAPYYSDLKAININPTFSARLGKRVTVGAGIDVMWSQLTLKQNYPWAGFPGSTGVEPDGGARLKGDGTGFGVNLGLTWQVTERQRLAITYRSPITVDYGGQFSLNNLTPAAVSFGATQNSDFGTRITFPTIVALGYGLQVTENFRVAADVEWIQFSKFKSLNLEVGRNAFLFPSTAIRQDWKDTFTAGIAGEWKFAPKWVLRGGYQFYQSPVPDQTYSPTIPDADQNVITIGLSYRTGPHTFDLGYGADFYATRNITNNLNSAFNGTYKNTVHLMALSYRYQFR